MSLLKSNGCFFVFFGLIAFPSYAELYFPPELLSVDGHHVADLSQFPADGTQVPGVYDVDIYFNQTLYARRAIRFDLLQMGNKSADIQDETGLIPCLNRELLDKAGVKTELFPTLMSMDKDQCVNLAEQIPGAFSRFDFQKMRLDLSVPQIVTRNRARGEIDPALWDEGINAAMINYNFSGSNIFSGNNNGRSYYLRLGSGLNLGAWRLRDDRNWNSYESRYGSRQQWQRIRSYVERPIIPLRSNLTLGESTTESNIFDSFAFRGVQLASDDNMLPDSQRGFSPVVRGVAESNAEVSISQNGYDIYRTTVAPGAFEISDLNPMYNGGDLDVKVREASGKIQVFSVPYTTLPMLQRKGNIKYSLTAGRYRDDSGRNEAPAFAQTTLTWGIPHNMTLYGGIQASPQYLAVQSGAGVDMGKLGALSFDLTNANSTLADGSEHQGQSLRFLYAQVLNLTGTSFRLVGYRYSTKGYHSFSETTLKTMKGRLNDHSYLDDHGQPVIDTGSDYYSLYDSKRARFEANISQSLGKYGSFWLTGVRQTYWNSSSASDSLQAGYSNSFQGVNYSLNYSYSRYKSSSALSSYKDKSISISVSVPLDRLFSMSSQSPVYATFNGNTDTQNNINHQTGLSGQLLSERNLNWNISQGYSRSPGQNATNGTAGGSYRGGYGNANVSYSYSKDRKVVNYGISGGALLHSGGLTIGQPLGETSALIVTPGVKGVGIANEPGVSTDWRGFTIKPYVSAYHENRIQVNTQSLDDMTDVENSVLRVVPTKGAVVRAEFKANRGYRILMTLSHKGQLLPFGTIISSGDSSGIVADDGLVYLSGMRDHGVITANWGSAEEQKCQADYHLTASEMNNKIIRFNAVCR